MTKPTDGGQDRQDRDEQMLDTCRHFLFELLRRKCEPRFHSARTPMTYEEILLRLPPRIAAMHRAFRRLHEWQRDDSSRGYRALYEAYEIAKNEAAWLFAGVIFVHPEPVWNDTLAPEEELAILTRMTWLFLDELLCLRYDE